MGSFLRLFSSSKQTLESLPQGNKWLLTSRWRNEEWSRSGESSYRYSPIFSTNDSPSCLDLTEESMNRKPSWNQKYIYYYQIVKRHFFLLQKTSFIWVKGVLSILWRRKLLFSTFWIPPENRNPNRKKSGFSGAKWAAPCCVLIADYTTNRNFFIFLVKLQIGTWSKIRWLKEQSRTEQNPTYPENSIHENSITTKVLWNFRQQILKNMRCVSIPELSPTKL